MRHFLVLLFIAGIFVFSCKTSEKEPKSLPNIVFIFADDMGYGDLPCYNPHSKIPAKHIEQLAAEGMRFTDAHAPAAVCVPSRYSLLTGRYPFRNTRAYKEGWIEAGRPTIASVLKAAGYQTGMVGKWHQGVVGEKNPPADTDLARGPLDCGFDRYFGIPASLDIQPYYYIRGSRPVALPTDTIGASEGTAPSPGQRKIQGPFYREGKIAPGYVHEEVLGKFEEEALDFIEKQSVDQAFFLYLALPAPHTPWLPDAAHRGKSGAGDYGDFTLMVDDVVGSVMASLKEKGMEENTLVILSSDNGPVWYAENVAEFDHNSVGKLSGMKGDALEGGHRLPFIAKWPGKIPANTVNDNLICFTDVLATFAEISQQTVPIEAEDSQSFLSLLQDEKHPPTREELVVISSGKKFAIRQGEWKLILAKGSGGFTDGYDPTYKENNPFEGRLYNLKSDPSEDKNLYGEHPKIVHSLSQRLEEIRKGE